MPAGQGALPEPGEARESYLILLPVGEVDLKGWQRELLADPALVVDRLGLQGGVLGAVAGGEGRKRLKLDTDLASPPSPKHEPKPSEVPALRGTCCHPVL